MKIPEKCRCGAKVEEVSTEGDMRIWACAVGCSGIWACLSADPSRMLYSPLTEKEAELVTLFA